MLLCALDCNAADVVVFQINDQDEFSYSSEAVWTGHELSLYLSKATLLNGSLGYLSHGKLKLVVTVEVLDAFYRSNPSSPEPSVEQAESEVRLAALGADARARPCPCLQCHVNMALSGMLLQLGNL